MWTLDDGDQARDSARDLLHETSTHRIYFDSSVTEACRPRYLIATAMFDCRSKLLTQQ